jgi:hypothetical protein
MHASIRLVVDPRSSTYREPSLEFVFNLKITLIFQQFHIRLGELMRVSEPVLPPSGLEDILVCHTGSGECLDDFLDRNMWHIILVSAPSGPGAILTVTLRRFGKRPAWTWHARS